MSAWQMVPEGENGWQWGNPQTGQTIRPNLIGYDPAVFDLVDQAATQLGIANPDYVALARGAAANVNGGQGYTQGANAADIANNIIREASLQPQYQAAFAALPPAQLQQIRNAGYAAGQGYYDAQGQVYKGLQQAGFGREQDFKDAQAKAGEANNAYGGGGLGGALKAVGSMAGGAAAFGQLAGAGSSALSAANSADALQTSALLGTDGAIASGSSVPFGQLASAGLSDAGTAGAFPSGPYNAVTDASSFGQPTLDSSKWLTESNNPLTNLGTDTVPLPNNGVINLADSGANVPWYENAINFNPDGGLTDAAKAAHSTITSGGDADLTGVTGGGAAGAGGAAASSPGLWSRIMDGTATADDWASLAGKMLPGALGAFASSQQSGALADLAKKYEAYGAPSRARYEASMSPGFDPMSIPGYAGALDSASSGILRKLSASGGNPYGNPSGLIEANKAIVNGTALPASQEYQRINAGAGGLANLAAAYPTTQAAATGANSNIYNSIGYGLDQVFNPKTSLADLLKQYGGVSAP